MKGGISTVEEWITTSEAAGLLNISERQVRNKAASGKLKAKRDGNRWLIDRSLTEVEVELEGNRSESDISAGSSDNYEVIVEKLEVENEWLKKRVEELERYLSEARQDAAEAGHRHDTVVMQMTKLLEYHQQPFWRKLFSRKALPAPIDKTIMNMEADEKKETNEN